MYNYKNYKDDSNYENLQRRIRRLLYISHYSYIDNIGTLHIKNPYDNIFNLRNSIELAFYM